MLRTEYNEAETLDRIKKDYVEQGKEIGLEQGKEIGEILTIIRLVNSHILSPTTAAEQLNISEDKFQSYIDNPELIYKCNTPSTCNV